MQSYRRSRNKGEEGLREGEVKEKGRKGERILGEGGKRVERRNL